MLSNKPYLVRAFFEWIVDSACTPYLVANAIYPHCKVPQQYVDENSQITLNVSPEAVRDLKISNEFVEFRASFSGIVHFISVPIKAVLAIYAQENGQGMFFDFEEENAIDEGGEWGGDTVPSQPENRGAAAGGAQDSKKQRPSHLKLVE